MKVKPENRIRPGDGDSRHGACGYSNHVCRCVVCRAAWAAYVARRRAERAKSNIPFLHGTENGYGNYGCRCRACTDAWSVAASLRRARARAQRHRGDAA